MKKRAEKKEDVEKLKNDLAKVSTVILTTFQGITVAQDTQLRRAVQGAGGKYRVVKNTLAEKAGAGTSAESMLKGLTGTNRCRWPRFSPKLPRTSRHFASRQAWLRGASYRSPKFSNWLFCRPRKS
jgi:hypothetical protein